MEVPQIPFVDRVLDILVMPQRRARTVQTVQKLGDSTAQFLDKVVDAPCCQRQVHGLVSAETCGGPAVAVFDLVVDVPVMQFIDKVGRHRDLAEQVRADSRRCLRFGY